MQRPSFSIYDASAGSGKTYALVKEYLKIILTAKTNDAYRNILAITFTNKAVHEMKSRIIDSLSEFSKDIPNGKALELINHLSAETALTGNQIKLKSQQIIKHIIHNYAAFDISTIDKFTHKIIRAFANDLNLPLSFEVTLDTENLLMEAVDALIAKAGEDEELTKLLVDFTMEKADDDKSWDVSREILETGRLILNENNREEIAHFEGKSITQFLDVKNKLSEMSKRIEEECVECAKNALMILEKNGIDPKSFSSGHFPNHLNSIYQNSFNPKNKTYRSSEDVRINKTAPDRMIIDSVLPELLSILECVYINYEKRDFYRAFLKNITPLSLLNTLSKELNTIKEEQNVLSIAEFNAIINREIQGQPAPFIYERIGERYRHFFIDEFQDTSEMQWLNLIPLIDNATSSEIDGEKGTLMIVGDPKQSIYRWRGGKAEQFIALANGQNPFNNPDQKLEHLDRNYRSYSEIIHFNNSFFKYLAEEFEHADYKNLYENRSHQFDNDKTGGYVNITFLSNNVETEETSEKSEMYVRATVNVIEKSKALGFDYKDIAILTRKREQGIAIANYLTQQSIPILSSETLMIANATEVQLIIHILKYLKDSADLKSKANILYFLGRNQQRMPLHDYIFEGMSKISEADFESWLSNSDLSFSFKDVRKKSLYEAAEIVISKFIKSEKNNAYLQYFLDVVLERDIRNRSGISDFLDYWDKNAHKFSIPSPEGTNAIRIMTIHKSKGLEFPVVIMPFADEDYSRKPKDKIWLHTDEEIVGIPKLLIDNSSSVGNFGTAAASIYNEKKQEELLDNINVLYVALTRAEEQLYIISSMNLDKEGEPRNNSMASFFTKYLKRQNLFDPDRFEYEFGNFSRLSEKTKFIENTVTIPMVSETLDRGKIKIAQKEALMWGTHQQDAIEYGNIVHEILSFINTKNDIVPAIEKAVENGLISRQEAETVRNTIDSIVNNIELRDYFSTGSNILNEQTIIRKQGNALKPDRMVLTPINEVLLLDYKTGAPEAKYHIQLEEYQNAIEKMGYKVVKKALVYIGKQINVVNL